MKIFNSVAVLIAGSVDPRKTHFESQDSKLLEHLPTFFMTLLRILSPQLASDWESGEDEVVRKLLLEFDWYILPVFNVDGYEYSWSTVS